MGRVIRGSAAVRGAARGDVLGSTEPLSFWGGYDAADGRIIDRRHPLSGRTASGLVLAVPGTRGSSTTTAVLLEAVRRGTAPAAILTRGTDRFLALAAIVAQELYGVVLPVIALERDDFDLAASSSSAQVDEDGRVTLEPGPPPA